MKKQAARYSLLLVLGVLLIAALACKQSGTIITSAEATQRAIPSVTPTQELQEAIGAAFGEGDTVVMIGKGYLVPIYLNPGDLKVLSHTARGDLAVVVSSVLYKGEIWYQVDSVAGTGWTNADAVQAQE